MTEQQPPEWGAPQPVEPAVQSPSGRSAWTAKKTAAAVAIAVAIAGAGGVAIYAASGTNQQTGAAGPGGMGGAPPDGGGMRGGFGLGTETHGEFQTGEVTAISDSSVEVKSTDGYTRTYVIDAETVAEGVEKGDTVTVIATAQDGRSVASSVTEPGQRGQRNGQAPPTR